MAFYRCADRGAGIVDDLPGDSPWQNTAGLLLGLLLLHPLLVWQQKLFQMQSQQQKGQVRSVHTEHKFSTDVHTHMLYGPWADATFKVSCIQEKNSKLHSHMGLTQLCS